MSSSRVSFLNFVYSNANLYLYRNTYKCGVFFEDLTSRKPITWLGALPDALKKVKKDDYQEILGDNITPESFKNFNCDTTAANARCYTTVIKC